jgi:hypothetical protein
MNNKPGKQVKIASQRTKPPLYSAVRVEIMSIFKKMKVNPEEVKYAVLHNRTYSEIYFNRKQEKILSDILNELENVYPFTPVSDLAHLLSQAVNEISFISNRRQTNHVTPDRLARFSYGKYIKSMS